MFPSCRVTDLDKGRGPCITANLCLAPGCPAARCSSPGDESSNSARSTSGCSNGIATYDSGFSVPCFSERDTIPANSQRRWLSVTGACAEKRERRVCFWSQHTLSFKQAFNSRKSHAGGTSPFLCLATDQIMLQSSRENWIKNPCCCVVIFFFFLFLSLNFLNQCYTLFLLCYAALWCHPLHSSQTATPPSVAASSSSLFQSWPLPWSPWSLIREAKCNICTTKLAFFSLPPPLSCCLVWGRWLLPGWSRAFPGNAVTSCDAALWGCQEHGGPSEEKSYSGIRCITSLYMLPHSYLFQYKWKRMQSLLSY